MLTNTNFPSGYQQFGAFSAPSVQASPKGAVIFVDSATGSDSRSRLKFFGSAAASVTQGAQQGPQGDPSYPLASVFGTNGALTFCVASRGDIIVVMPGHTESLSTNGSYAIPAGVQIVGIGARALRPQFTLTGGTATTITPGASVTIFNCHFDISTVNALVKGFNFTGAGASLVGCRIVQAAGATVATNAITVAAADVAFYGCEIDATASAGAASAIASGAASARPKIIGCDIRGDYSTANLVSSSTFHFTLADIANNVLVQLNGTAKAVISFTTSTTGVVRYNTFIGKTWSSAADAIASSTSTSLRWIENYGFDDGAGVVSGVLVPAAGTIS